MMKVERNAKGDGLTITIRGKQYKTLVRMAELLNTTAHNGNTAETVCRDFLMLGPSQQLDNPKELARIIVELSECAEVDAAFVEAGLHWPSRR